MTVKQFPIFQLLDHIKKKHLQFPILFVITEKDSGMAKDLIFLSSDSSNKKKKVTVLLPSEHLEHFVHLHCSTILPKTENAPASVRNKG